MKKAFVLMVAILGLTLSTMAFAQTIPADLQVALFYKIFDFDQSLSEFSGSQITIGLYYDPNDNASKQAEGDIKQAISQVSDRTIAGKAVVIKEITTVDGIDESINILYVVPGSDGALKAIVEKCAKNKIFGISANEEYARQGLPLAIAVEDNKPKIIVNRSQAELCGVKLSSKLLALAKII